jgi:hypothetical protein
LCYKHRRLDKIGVQEIGEVHHFWLGLIAASTIVGLRTEGAERNLLASGFHLRTDSKFASDWCGCVQVRESEIFQKIAGSSSSGLLLRAVPRAFVGEITMYIDILWVLTLCGC